MTPKKTPKKTLWALLLLGAAGSPVQAQDLSEILNYTAFPSGFASSGQPTAAQLEAVRDAGFERIIYIAFSSDRNALANEDSLVRELGMDYVHIPVVWSAPTVADFENFAAVMQSAPDRRTLLHCQVNMRASAFAFLYRVIHEGVPMAQAKADMNLVWEPDATWRALIFDVLERNGLSPDCENCDWPR